MVLLLLNYIYYEKHLLVLLFYFYFSFICWDKPLIKRISYWHLFVFLSSLSYRSNHFMFHSLPDNMSSHNYICFHYKKEIFLIEKGFQKEIHKNYFEQFIYYYIMAVWFTFCPHHMVLEGLFYIYFYRYLFYVMVIS